MGFPPPPDLAPPDPPKVPSVPKGIAVGGSFSASPHISGPCGLDLGIDLSLAFGFKLPSIDFPPKIPIPFLHLKLSCDLSNPVDVSAGLDWGGGRTSNADPDPDDIPEDEAA